MDAFGVIFLLGVGTYIVVKVIRKQNKKDNYLRAKHLQSKYPNGFREKFNTYYISENDSYDELSRMASVSEYELQRIEDRIKAERERKRQEEEGKRRLEEEARRAEQERQRKIREERERKERELNEKYLALKRKYPHGSATFEKRHIGAKLKEDLIANESTLDKYEKCYSEFNFYDSWNKNHSEFAQKCRDLRNSHLKSWGCYKYSVDIAGKNEVGASKTYSFTIWEMFCDNFCSDTSLDYSSRKSSLTNYNNLQQFFDCERYFYDSNYDTAVEYIKNIPGNVLVVFNDSEKGISADDINNYHFGHLKALLSEANINYVDIDNKAGLRGSKASNIIVIELVTSNEHLKNTCKLLLDDLMDNKPCLLYMAMLKEHTSTEMSAIIESDKKAEREKIEKERLEREEKERKEQEEREQREREERENMARQERARLNSLSHTNKTNSAEFQTYLRSNGIRYLYHFTDRRNIASIRNHGGLYSWKYCEDHNITIPNPGGDSGSRSLDMRHGLEDYVRLSFCDDHPMAWRLSQRGADLVLLKVKIDVAWLQETLFSDINATDNNHHHGATMADLRRVDLNATQQNYVSNSSPIFKKHQAEVLVKTFIPLEYIININNPEDMFDDGDSGNDYLDSLPF